MQPRRQLRRRRRPARRRRLHRPLKPGPAADAQATSTPIRPETTAMNRKENFPDQAAEGYRAMDDRRAIKVLLQP
ncbi:hypothetical protein GCM10010170_010980 [Dactylosporangium salmoneum]|uniref:Uncharacterized protein n=1 Tax=Dactylosporangium salmoneum TaxID=53361 RepID=A0ABP5SIP4_9ACTN